MVSAAPKHASKQKAPKTTTAKPDKKNPTKSISLLGGFVFPVLIAVSVAIAILLGLQFVAEVPVFYLVR